MKIRIVLTGAIPWTIYCLADDCTSLLVHQGDELPRATVDKVNGIGRMTTRLIIARTGTALEQEEWKS